MTLALFGAPKVVADGSHRTWPEVTEEYHRLRARPGLIVAGLAAVGLAGAAAELRRRRRRRAG